MNGIRLNLNSQKVFNRKGCSRASNLERIVFPGYQGPMVELTTLPSPFPLGEFLLSPSLLGRNRKQTPLSIGYLTSSPPYSDFPLDIRLETSLSRPSFYSPEVY